MIASMGMKHVQQYTQGLHDYLEKALRTCSASVNDALGDALPVELQHAQYIDEKIVKIEDRHAKIRM